MGRIGKYAQDSNVTRQDKLLGSDGGGATKNFSLDSISTFLKESNAAGPPLQFNYRLNQDSALSTGEAKLTTSSGTTFANVTSINVSKYRFRESLDISTALSVLNSKKIIIIDIQDNNNYGTYTLGTFADSNGDGFYEAALTVSSSNGSFTDGTVYAMSSYNDMGDAHVAKPFSDTNTVSIAHNLAKFPSVSVKLSSGKIAYGDVNHTDNNNLTITFSENQTGVAYLN